MADLIEAEAGIAPLAELIGDAERILVFTGAGISTARGIPDFRGPDGVWKTKTPVFYQAFMTDHDARVEYWQQKAEGSAVLDAAKPNAVHRAIVDLERSGKVELVVTQNVDGLHRQAGTAPEHLVEIHGTTREIECQTCRERSAPEPHLERLGRQHAQADPSEQQRKAEMGRQHREIGPRQGERGQGEAEDPPEELLRPPGGRPGRFGR